MVPPVVLLALVTGSACGADKESCVGCVTRTRVHRLAVALIACLPGCADRTLASATDADTLTSTTDDPATTTGDPTTGEPDPPVPTTTGPAPGSTGEPSTGEPMLPGFCGEPGPVGLVWQESMFAVTLADGDFGDGVAVDPSGKVLFVSNPGAGTDRNLVLNLRTLDGAPLAPIAIAGTDRERPDGLALAADGSALHIVSAGNVLAVRPGDGAVLWEHASGPLLQFEDILPDPDGGALVRGTTGSPNGVLALDAAGGLRFSFTDDADPSDDHAGFARTGDGSLILAFDTFVADPPANLRVRKYAAGGSKIAWQTLGLRDNRPVISAAVEASDGALYLAGAESKAGLGDYIITLYRLTADGELEWATPVAADPTVHGDGVQRLLALPGGEVLLAATAVPQIFRYAASGELVGATDIPDDFVRYTGVALAADPCAGAVFVHTGFLAQNGDDWHAALTVGRLRP